MPTEPARPFRRLVLRVAVQIEPIQGQLLDEHGTVWDFTGWLDLVEVLELQRARAS